MSAIDELVIAVRIDEGSNLEELYQMLKQLQAQGGKLEINKEDLNYIGNRITPLTSAINRVTKTMNELKKLFPNIPEFLERLVKHILKPTWDLVWERINALSSFASEAINWQSKTEAVIDTSRTTIEYIHEKIKAIFGPEVRKEGKVVDIQQQLKELFGEGGQKIDMAEINARLEQLEHFILDNINKVFRAIKTNIGSGFKEQSQAFEKLRQEQEDTLTKIRNEAYDMVRKWLELDKSIKKLDQGYPTSGQRKKEYTESLNKFKGKLDKNIEEIVDKMFQKNLRFIIHAEFETAYEALWQIIENLGKEMPDKPEHFMPPIEEGIEEKVVPGAPKPVFEKTWDVMKAKKRGEIGFEFDEFYFGSLKSMFGELLTQFFTQGGITTEKLSTTSGRRLIQNFSKSSKERENLMQLFGIKDPTFMKADEPDMHRIWAEAARDFKWETVFFWKGMDETIHRIDKNLITENLQELLDKKDKTEKA